MRKRRAIRAAKALLAELAQVYPPVDVQKIAKELGLEVVERENFQLRDQEVSGLLLRREGRAIVVLNRRQHHHRKRFTLAHEIAHFVLHPPRESYVDDVGGILARDLKSAAGIDIQEIEANAFAAELLMPEGALRDEVVRPLDLFFDDRKVSDLARRFEVSREAMTYRLTNLGLLHP